MCPPNRINTHSSRASDKSEQATPERDELPGMSMQPSTVAAMYARAFAINPAAIGIVRLDNGRIVDVNDAWQRIFGYSRNEAIGRSAIDLHLWRRSEDRNRFIKDLHKGGSFRDREHVVLRKSGESFEALCAAEIMTIGNDTFIVSTWLDISEQKQSEEALRESESKFRSLFENSPDAVFLTIPNGTILAANPAACAMFGWTEQEICNMGSAGLLDMEDPRLSAGIDERLRIGRVHGWEITAIRKNGQKFPVEVDSVILKGEPVRSFVIMHDISKRKSEQEALRKSEHLLSESQRAGHIGSWSRDIGAERIQWSDETYRIYGLTPDLFIPTPGSFINLIHTEDRALMQRFIHACAAGEHPRDVEFRIIHADGSIRTLCSCGDLQCSPDGTPRRLIGTVQDITERKRAEEELKRSRKNLAEAQRQTHIGSFEFDFPTGRLDWSEEMFRICGVRVEDFQGTMHDFLERVHPEDLAQLEKNREKGLTCTGPLDLAFRIVRPNGETRYIRMIFETTFNEDGSPLRRLGTFQDITGMKQAEEERAKLEAQLQQAQKIESIGRLAGGVAHDFNNMLSVILGHTELALEQMNPEQPLHADLKEIQEAAQRSADLTRQLLAFARKQTVVPSVLDLNETVLGVLGMLRRLIGENIELVWLPEADLWPIEIDPSQIDQILTNLCVNARDAIANTGKITIKTENRIYSEEYRAKDPSFLPGEFVVLHVSDNGHGMDQETMAHIFEPFFTTKGVGEGTGLGLPTVYGIVKQNNGFINVESTAGQGTIFEIYLPRYVEKATGVSEKSATETTAGGEETILLVEDESSILKLATRMLENHGYTVLAASTPGEAMHLAKNHQGQIHILMTDVIMPEMNGRELAKNLLSLYPHLKCLFMSGYTDDIIASHNVLAPGTCFLQKPFSIKKLSAALTKLKQSD